MQPRAVTVLAVGVARRRERRDRAVAVAQPARGSSPSANQAVAKPGASLDRLRQNVGGGRRDRRA